ncbi:unnamed protein product [Sphacelaria rigidula]
MYRLYRISTKLILYIPRDRPQRPGEETRASERYYMLSALFIHAYIKKAVRRKNTCFSNKTLTQSAQKSLPSHIIHRTQAYVFVPGVLSRVKQRINLADLHKCEKAKYMYTTGDAFGSLTDLVRQELRTTFPLQIGKLKSVWGEK